MPKASNLISPEMGTDEDVGQRHPIDMVYLAKQTLGDSGLEAEILLMFNEIAAGYMARLLAGGTKGEITHNLHTLKGASLGVGAASIANLAKAAEDEFREHHQLREESVADLAMAVEEASTFITGLLKDYEMNAEA